MESKLSRLDDAIGARTKRGSLVNADVSSMPESQPRNSCKASVGRRRSRSVLNKEFSAMA
jgi:hypothetical protein